MEINYLKESFPFKKSNLIPLVPFLVNGLIRVGNRIGSANIPSGQKHQVIISSKHPLASLVVLYFHEKKLLFLGRAHFESH